MNLRPGGNEVLRNLLGQTQAKLAERPRMSEVFTYLQANPLFILRAMGSLENAITLTNEQGGIEETYGVPLPTLKKLTQTSELFPDDPEKFSRTFANALSLVSFMMIEGEKENPRKPYLAFHIATFSPETPEPSLHRALAVAALIHIYEELAVQMTIGPKKQFMLDDIGNALIASVRNNPNNLLTIAARTFGWAS